MYQPVNRQQRPQVAGRMGTPRPGDQGAVRIQESLFPPLSGLNIDVHLITGEIVSGKLERLGKYEIKVGGQILSKAHILKVIS